jgi:hypothetical protein
MLIHDIKPEQLSQLERMFGKETKLGLELPAWLLRLRQTAFRPVKEKDFEQTLRLPCLTKTPLAVRG